MARKKKSEGETWVTGGGRAPKQVQDKWEAQREKKSRKPDGKIHRNVQSTEKEDK